MDRSVHGLLRIFDLHAGEEAHQGRTGNLLFHFKTGPDDADGERRHDHPRDDLFHPLALAATDAPFLKPTCQRDQPPTAFPSPAYARVSGTFGTVRTRGPGFLSSLLALGPVFTKAFADLRGAARFFFGLAVASFSGLGMGLPSG